MSSSGNLNDSIWTKHYSSKKNAHYWFNKETNQSVWSNPLPEDDINNAKLDPTLKKRPLDEPIDEFSSSKRKSVILKTEEVNPIVAIVVPFRDLHKEQQRAAHLAAFVPAMTRFTILYAHFNI